MVCISYSNVRHTAYEETLNVSYIRIVIKWN